MSNQIWIGLQITLLGMGLVFVAILLLWGLMVLLVRWSGGKSTEALSDQERAAEYKRKHKAAIAAVTIALAQELDSEPHEFPLPPTAVVSAWQTVMRTTILNKRGPIR